MARIGMGRICRVAGVVDTDMGDGTIAVITPTKHAHALDVQASAVWKACQGPVDPEVLAARLELPVGEVDRVLRALSDAGLIVGLEPRAKGPGLTRRAVLAGGLGGGAALITTIALPTAAMAASIPIGSTQAGGGQGSGGVYDPGGSGGVYDPGGVSAASTASGNGGMVPASSTTPASGGGFEAGADEAGSPAGNQGGTLAYTGAPLEAETIMGAALVAGGAALVAASKKPPEPGVADGAS